jgi:hypothetical protein
MSPSDAKSMFQKAVTTQEGIIVLVRPCFYIPSFIWCQIQARQLKQDKEEGHCCQDGDFNNAMLPVLSASPTAPKRVLESAGVCVLRTVRPGILYLSDSWAGTTTSGVTPWALPWSRECLAAGSFQVE